jgi:hypothetical protein
MQQDSNFRLFVPTAAQQLDTKVFNHIASLLHGSASFGYRLGA